MDIEYEQLINDAPFGYAYQRVILNDCGKPNDFEFLVVNRAFEKMTGLKRSDIINKMVREVMPGLINDSFDWGAAFGDVALNGGEKVFEQFSETRQRWYRVQVSSPRKYYFTTTFLDITAEKENTETLEAFFSVNLDLLCIADINGNFIKTNEAWAEILGYSTDELNSKQFLDFVHPDDREATFEAIKDLRDQKRVYNFVNRYLGKDGSYKFIEWRSFPKGELIYAAARDITGRIEAEAEIRKTRDQFQSLVENIPGITYRCDYDSEWTMRYMSVDVEVISGYKPHEFINNAFRTYASIIHNDDKEMVSRVIKDAIAGNSPWEIEYRICHKNGDIRWVMEKGRAVFALAGEILYLDGFIQDVTELRNANLKLAKVFGEQQILLDNIPVQVWYLKDASTYGAVNRSHAEFYGVKPEDIAFKSFADLYPAVLADEYRENNLSLFLEARLQQTEEWVKHFSGEIRLLLINKTPKLNDAGEVEYVVCSAHDITEKKKAEDNLKYERDLFSSGPVFIIEWATGEDWGTRYVSENITGIIGYTPEEMQHEVFRYADLFHPEDRQRVSDEAAQNIAGGINYFEQSYRLRHKEGRYIWVHDSTMVVRDKNSRVRSVRGYIFDQTHMKEYDDQLTRERSRLMNIIEGTNAGTWEWNIQTGEMVCNKRFAEIIGYQLEELFPLELKRFATMTHPEDLKKVRKLLAQHVDGDLAFYEAEIRMKHKEGHWVWINQRGKVSGWTEDGKPLIMQGTHIDVNRRKQAEEALYYYNRFLTLVAEISSDFIPISEDSLDQIINSTLKKTGAFFVVDRSYLFLLSDDQQRMSNTHEWCSKGIPAQIHSLEDIPIDSLPWWKKQLLNNSAVYINSVDSLPPEASKEKEVFKNQQIKSLLTVPITAFDGKVIGFFGFDSVRKRKRWEEEQISYLKVLGNIMSDAIYKARVDRELKEALQQAELASKAKSDFLANMSHEIRTPLNSVIGFSELLAKTPVSDMQRQYIDHINNSAQSLLGIINDILDLAKIEAGKLELNPVKTDLIELIESTVDIVNYHASEKGLEFLFKHPLELPRFIEVDPIRLKQILVNLLNNAIKFTDKGEVLFTVLFAEKNSLKGLVTFIIKDTGIGIDDEQRVKLFQAFAQADNSTTRQYGGTGLGLTISNMLAEKMGSSIELESKPGSGSQFSFTIEVIYEHSEGFDDQRFNNIKRVLIVDDNDNNRMIIKNTLDYWGIDCLEASDSKTALAIIKDSGPFDVMIVDYHLPDQSGIELIKIIRQEVGLTREKQPVILLHSSSEDADLYQACKQVGVCFNLVKPVKASELQKYLVKISANKDKMARQENNVADKPKEEKDKGINTVVTILIAEDVATNMFLIKSLLKDIIPSAVITEAKNGREAYNMVIALQPDLVLMDIQMPEMDGVEATRKIREEENERGLSTPIIALTAGALKEERKRCLEAGMDDFLTKPIDIKSLKNTLRKYLDE